MSWLARAWRYSRTLTINVINGIAVALTQLVPIALGLDWSSVFTPKVLVLWMFFLNALNVVLRYLTTAPVGEKED